MKNQRTFPIKIIFSTFALALLIGLVFFSVQSGRAGTDITVNSTEDKANNDNMCTLREAIIAANKDKPSGSKPKECPAGSGADTIILPVPTPRPDGSIPEYKLTRTDNGNEDSSQTGDLDILDDVIIKANGPGVTIVGEELSFSDRVIHVLSGNVTIQGITIKGGNLSGSGGGIRNEAQLTLSGVTISGNTADEDGGGISNAPGAVLTMTNSTLSGNFADGWGGGIFNEGTATLNNVTISENTADSNDDGTGDGGGAANGAGILTIKNTIVAGNPGSSDCSGMITSGGYNIAGDASCNLGGPGDMNNTDPLLGSLQDNGGNTFTYEPGAGSPAIDAGNPATPGSGGDACEQTDQRGTYRPHGEACDIGAVEAGGPNASLIVRAFSEVNPTTEVTVVGRLTGAPGKTFTLYLYTSPSTDPDAVCDTTSSGGTFVGELDITTDSSGNVIFVEVVDTNQPVNYGDFIVASTTDLGKIESDYSQCVRVGPGNDSWTRALRLTLEPPDPPDPENPNLLEKTYDQTIDLIGGSLWYKFSVEPHSKVIVTLTDLPANYDLTVYKDIAQAFSSFSSDQDLEALLRLGAEFAPDAFTPDAFTPDAFTPDAFTPDAFTPDAFTPDAFTPDAFTPDAFTPDAFTPDAFTPDAFTPDAFTPDAFTPDAFTPDAFTPDAFTPDAFTPDAFTSAQTRSLIAISAFDGQVSEGVLVNTWDSYDTDFYIRVRGRNGAFNPLAAFHLEVRQIVDDNCSNFNAADLPPSNFPVQANNGYKTIILTNLNRLEGTTVEKSDLWDRLIEFADPVLHPEVSGVIVDLGQEPQGSRVAEAYNTSDANPDCPAAQNLLAASIKELVDTYRANPLEYVVIVGGDNVIPFFRHADHAMLANEQNYIPPVRNGTISQSSLRYGNVLSQDDYGAQLGVSYKDDEFPIPELAVGRLVETAWEATTMLDAYLSTQGGVVVPSNSLVTTYDFLVDTGLAVLSEFEAGIGAGSTNTLITPRDVAPTDPSAWTADDLRDALLGTRHDLIFLAGHFSGNSALAADFTTRVLAKELADSSLDLTNVILFSAGCHAGYNIVDPHGITEDFPRQPDWAQAAARKGLTLISGTGYQYGDTDFIRYSEKLYLEFSRQLRVGEQNQSVPIGQALVRAKQTYLLETPFLRGIDEKAVLEATLFGLPMLSVNMPGERLGDTGKLSIVKSMNAYNTGPGAALGLTYADIVTPTDTIQYTRELTHVDNLSVTSSATYYEGVDGILVKPQEPTLPLQIENVSVDNTVLRGVGFRAGTYSDFIDKLPFTGAAATEIRGVHTPFLTNVFYPTKLYGANYFDALADGLNGVTNLFVYPAQFKSNPPSLENTSPLSGTWRTYQEMGLRLYYSSNTETFTDTNGVTSTPALAAAPTIAVVSSQIGNDHVTFRMRVVGNPAAGIQEVWVTYTGESGPLYGSWQSLDLTQQNPSDSTEWEGTLMLPAGVSADQIRYIVQAVNGVGLVSMDTNKGAYYIPGAEAGPTTATELVLVAPPDEGRYTTQVTISATLSLKSTGDSLEGQRVVLALGPQSRLGITGADGVATVTLSNYALPGDTQIRASFAGVGDYQASYDTSPFLSLKQDTQITLDPELPVPAVGYPEDTEILTATLTDVDGRGLGEETLIFIVSGSGEVYREALITDYAGRARLGNIPLPPGEYTVQVYFSGDIPLLLPPPDDVLSLEDTRYNPSERSIADSNNGTITLVKRTVDDLYVVDEDSVLDGNVLDNDNELDGYLLSVSAVNGDTNNVDQQITLASGALLAVNTDGSFSYDPNGQYEYLAVGETAQDSFTYTASDGNGGSDTATVSITIVGVNDAPVADDDSYSTNEDIVLTVLAPGVLDGDTDADGDNLTAVLDSGPISGTLTLNADGSFSYDPNGQYDYLQAGETALENFTYTVSDGNGGSDTATVSITVDGVNDAPVAEDDDYSMYSDAVLTIAAPGILGNDSDVDEDNLTAVLDSGPSKGTLTLNGDGSFTYDPNGQYDYLQAGETALENFTYTVSDGNGGSDTATVSITIDGICSSVVADVVSLWPPNGDLHLVTLTCATDPNGDLTTIIISQNPNGLPNQGVWQDEEVGSAPDAVIYGDNTVDLRSERDGNGDGRVYHIFYTLIDDLKGGTWEGELKLGVVDHDQGGDLGAIDGGALYNSEVPD